MHCMASAAWLECPPRHISHTHPPPLFTPYFPCLVLHVQMHEAGVEKQPQSLSAPQCTSMFTSTS